MSEVTTPVSTPESGFELVPNPAGTEEGAGGSEETGLFAEGASPGLDAETPEQQVEAPPAEQVKAPEQQAEVTTQQPIPAKEDESRYEYWQSQANQRQKELDTLKGDQTQAIARYIRQNPEMLDVVEEVMRGGPIRKPRGIPERPLRPQRPENYDKSEAHDPETLSGRFRAEYDDYLEKKDIFNDAREEQATVRVQREEDKAQLAELRSGLIGAGGLNEIEANEFLELLSGPEARNPVTLAKFYRVLKAPSQDAIANQKKAKELLAKQEGLQAPPPLATAPGESPKQTTDEEDYSAALRASADQGSNLV